MSAESSTAPIAEAVIAKPQEVGFKVFVGNLAFSTKNADLRETFSKHGQVSEAVVIHRGSRSLGYGFVTFENEEEATKAVAATDKSELGGRTINVELAKPPSATPAGRVPKEAAKAAVEQGHAEGEEVAEGIKRTSKPRNKRTGPKSRRPRTDNDTEEAGDALPSADPAVQGQEAAEGQANIDAAVKPKKKRAPRKKGPKAAAVNGDAAPENAEAGDSSAAGAATEGEPSASTQTRKPRERRGPPQGEPSKTMLFVANLPFSVTDESLKDVFEGLQVKSAKVVTKKFGPSEGRSKGFAFVDFADEQQQQAALQQFQGKEVAGRQIGLKVAIEQPPRQNDDSAPAEEATA
ncbi:hypothetical protein OIV83_000886 [Microbotryomycetes sp. JL201]|nr:hypothetical protein OIV83_000886 [Microbotryomycetes sp. JL201]